MRRDAVEGPVRPLRSDSEAGAQELGSHAAGERQSDIARVMAVVRGYLSPEILMIPPEVTDDAREVHHIGLER